MENSKASIKGSQRVMDALKEAGREARKIAIQTNTNLIVVRDGKVVRIPPDELRRELAAEDSK